jgi:hypothetical protein
MQVKNLALAATALVALGAAAPAQADDVKPKYAVDVYINIFHTWSNDDDSSSDIEDSTAGLDGRTTLNVPFSDSGALQFDLVGMTELGTDYSDTTNDETLTDGFGFVSEMNFRDGDGLFGGFMGAGTIGLLDDDAAMYYLAGLEAQWWCDNWTFGVQLGAADGDGSDAEVVTEAVFVNGEVRYYLSKVTRLRLNGGYLDGSHQDDDDVEIWWWGARVDHWVGKTIPTSVFAAVEGFDAEEDVTSGSEFDEITLKLGIALHFGVTDQMDNDRNGKANIHLDYVRMMHAGGPALK